MVKQKTILLMGAIGLIGVAGIAFFSKDGVAKLTKAVGTIANAPTVISDNLKPITGGGMPFIQKLAAPITAKQVNLVGVKPEVKFTHSLPQLNTLISGAFAKKLAAASKDTTLQRERAEFFAEDIVTLTPSKKDSEGFTAFDRRVMDNPNYIGSKWTPA